MVGKRWGWGCRNYSHPKIQQPGYFLYTVGYVVDHYLIVAETRTCKTNSYRLNGILVTIPQLLLIQEIQS